MSEIFAQDIELAILTRLKDNTYGLQAQLDIINTTRSQSTPEVLDANISTERRDENPEVIIDYESSAIDNYFGDTDMSALRKTCTLTVTAFLSSADLTNIKKYVSNYIEAITKSLHKFSTGNITACLAKEDIIADLYKDEYETTKFGGIKFDVLINGGI